jgi:hypothetical protein
VCSRALKQVSHISICQSIGNYCIASINRRRSIFDGTCLKMAKCIAVLLRKCKHTAIVHSSFPTNAFPSYIRNGTVSSFL